MKYFSIRELTASATAKRLGIDNCPDKRTEENLVELAETVLDPIREAYGKPIVVTSGYRCLRLNKAVGGASTSQHMYGQAADIRSLTDMPDENKKIFFIAMRLIEQGKINVGQLIDEHHYDWIHISTPGGHRNEILHIR